MMASWKPTPRTATPYRTHALTGKCTCPHEDWQHAIGATCAGGKTASSCPCTARWIETGWHYPEQEEA